jgi:SAM-dependent methyltransferase
VSVAVVPAPARRPRPRSKRAYYRGRGVPPALVRYYFARLGPVRRVLDLGCGSGAIGAHRPDRATEVFGVDADELAVALASTHERATCVDLGRGELPFEDRFFDAVVAKDILEHLERPWEIVAEARRVLRTGGRLLVSVPMPKPSVVWGDYTHVRGFTKAALTLLLEDCGFAVESVWRMGGVPATARLGLIGWVPKLLLVPGIGRLYASSFEALAVPSED